MFRPTLAIVVAGALTASACDLDVPDLNNPSLDQLETNPTAVAVGAAATGLLIGSRRNHAFENGYVAQLGIIGREAYCFDSADPRFISELIEGTLNAGSPFGGNFWPAPYANIRLGNVILHALDKLPTTELDDASKSGVRGFVHTMQALDLLEVINTHDTNGAVIDTDQPIVRPPDIQPLGAIVDKPVVMTEIARLLDAAVPELTAAGASFPFLFDSGFAGFDTPKTFLQVNRGLRARVAVYVQDYPAALTALATSFLDDVSEVAALDLGAYYTYTTKSGDTPNGLLNPNLYVHPSVAADAQMNGLAIDARYARKVGTAGKPGSAKGLSSSLAFTLYASPSSPVSVIRMEELLLLKAEALFFTGQTAAAMKELNIVRTQSGKLTLLPDTTDAATFTSQLLYERRYSLLFEGHRWIDVRRFNKLDTLPLDKPTHTINKLYPIPLPECNARPGEPRCPPPA
jgi:starch-binding outer membrane protein, SusD/RagB family